MVIYFGAVMSGENGSHSRSMLADVRGLMGIGWEISQKIQSIKEEKP
jgi:hypothetical protein